jgi:hypothetical protein
MPSRKRRRRYLQVKASPRPASFPRSPEEEEEDAKHKALEEGELCKRCEKLELRDGLYSLDVNRGCSAKLLATSYSDYSSTKFNQNRTLTSLVNPSRNLQLNKAAFALPESISMGWKLQSLIESTRAIGLLSLRMNSVERPKSVKRMKPHFNHGWHHVRGFPGFRNETIKQLRHTYHSAPILSSIPRGGRQLVLITRLSALG